MFVLEFYFSETSLNALDLFTRFLLDVPFPKNASGCVRIAPRGF
jgi:hypothetical protein